MGKDSEDSDEPSFFNACSCIRTFLGLFRFVT